MRFREILPLAATIALCGCEHDRAGTTTPSDGAALRCLGRFEPENLLPKDAAFVAYYDMNRERRFAPRTTSLPTAGPRTLLPTELEAVRLGWIGIAAACELDDRFFGEAWLAGKDGEGIVVLEGEGVGAEKNLRCIYDRLGQIDPSVVGGTTMRSSGCGLEIEFDHDGVSGFAPTDDILVLGTDAGVEGARAVWNGGFPNPPRDLLPEKGSKAWLWGAVDVQALDPDELEGAIASEAQSELGLASSIRTVQFEATMTRRLAFVLGATFASESDVRGAHAVLAALIASPPPALPQWAQTLLSRARLDREGARVSIELPLDRHTAYALGLLPNRAESKQMPAFAWISALLVL